MDDQTNTSDGATAETAAQAQPAAEAATETEGADAAITPPDVAPAEGDASAPHPGAELPDGGSIVVTGPRQGRWRAGRRFDREPVRLAVADLADGDLGAILADPRLTVTVESADETAGRPLKAPKKAARRTAAKPKPRRR